MSPERRWLILSYFSGIDGMACAQHLDDRLPHLRRGGITPLLLTGVCGDKRDGMVHVRVPSVAPSGLRFEIRHVFRKSRLARPLRKALEAAALLPIYPFYFLEKLFADLDSQWSWFPLAAAAGDRLCAAHDPELLYSTGGPWSAHLAAALIARRRGIPWVAEIQDPVIHGDWARGRAAFAVCRRVERLICRRADAVIFLTEGARASAARRTDLGDRGWVVYPGADPAGDAPAGYRAGERCRFAHFGSLGGSRNVKTFLSALDLLFRESPGLAAATALDLYGTCDRVSWAQIRAFPHPGVVTVHGRLGRRDSLAAMRRSDVLLLIQNTEEYAAETIPSKVYEYLHAGRPVLGLVHGNAELRSILERQGHFASDAADPAAVKAVVARLASAWRGGELESRPSASSYTVAAAVDAILEKARTLPCSGRPRQVRA